MIFSKVHSVWRRNGTFFKEKSPRALKVESHKIKGLVFPNYDFAWTLGFSVIYLHEFQEFSNSSNINFEIRFDESKTCVSM